MKQFVRLGTALACGLVVVGAVLAQTRTDTRTVTSTTTTVHKGTVFMGANVVLQDNTSVGRVEDFVITDGGCIDYVVVSYDSKYVLVPWTVATWTGDRTVRVNITQARFREVPTFTRDAWPNLTDTQYIQRVRTAWGVTDSRYGDPNRQPLDRRDERRDIRDDRRDNRDQRRDDKTRPPDRRDDRRDTRDDRRDTRDARDQRKDVENPNRPPTTNPDRRDDRRDNRDQRKDDRDKDKNPPRPPDRPPPPPPPQ
jgi:hypothetical protein